MMGGGRRGSGEGCLIFDGRYRADVWTMAVQGQESRCFVGAEGGYVQVYMIIFYGLSWL